MTDRGAARRGPLMRSVTALRWAVAALTFLSFGGTAFYAAGHTQNPDAPLKPAAQASPSPSPTPAVTRGRLTLTPQVQTTPRQATTRTHQS